MDTLKPRDMDTQRRIEHVKNELERLSGDLGEEVSKEEAKELQGKVSHLSGEMDEIEDDVRDKEGAEERSWELESQFDETLPPPENMNEREMHEIFGKMLHQLSLQDLLQLEEDAKKFGYKPDHDPQHFLDKRRYG